MYVSIANYFHHLLLLAGDVSLNPGPSGSNDKIKIAAMNVQIYEAEKSPPPSPNM